MSSYYININVKSDSQDAVEQAVSDIFEREGFTLTSSYPAEDIVEDEDMLPESEDWYGIILSGVAKNGWVTVYVADWQDSGVLARGLSRALVTPVLEIWAADDEHWGYTYYENGEVQDRFADDPTIVAESPDELALYEGQAERLSTILAQPAEEVTSVLKKAQEKAGQFPGGPIDDLAAAVGLHFEHAFTGYDYFFDDDPTDFGQDLENWSAFQHLAFGHPAGRERLAE